MGVFVGLAIVSLHLSEAVVKIILLLVFVRIVLSEVASTHACLQASDLRIDTHIIG